MLMDNLLHSHEWLAVVGKTSTFRTLVLMLVTSKGKLFLRIVLLVESIPRVAIESMSLPLESNSLLDYLIS